MGKSCRCQMASGYGILLPMKALPEKFTSRMQAMLGSQYDAFIAQYNEPPVRGLRGNLLKVTPGELKELCPFELEPADTLAEGFVLRSQVQGIGAHPYHMAGLFYMQEPSAMAAIEAVQAEPGMRVLDLCAAPGGKSGGIAGRLGGRGLMVSNEIVPGRAKTLYHTLERLGVCNGVVTCAHPDALCRAMEGYFDRVVVDAPCSGEGMFRKDDTAIEEWSEEHVAACAQRQRAILESAYIALRPGGRLIYSTCTFSREENEDTVAAFAGAHGDMSVELMHRLYPHTCKGEGHFIARLVKAGEDRRTQRDMPLERCRDKEYMAFLQDTFEVPPNGEAYRLKDGRIIILREPLPEGLANIRMLGAGVYAGDVQRGRFMPAHSLFMAEHGGRYKNTLSLAADSPELAGYLSGNTLPIDDALRGYTAVLADGYPVGFGKAVDGTLKNHLPKGLRVNV